MPEFVGALIYDSEINLAGLERDKNAAIAKLHSIGAEATKTFQNEIARSLAKSVRPEVFANDLAKSRALLQGFGNDANKIFEKALGRREAQRLLSPFVNELTTLKGQFKSSLQEVFSLRNVAGGIVSAGAITGAVHGLFEISKQVIAIGRDAVETRDKFNLVFGNISTVVRASANQIADSMGRARIDIEDFLASFGTFLQPFGFQRSSVSKLSQDLVKLAIDVGSLQNKLDPDVIRDFQSALSGETEPVKKYGVILTETRIKQEGFNLGLIKAGETLTEQQKVFIRYTILMKDLALAENNAINTGDSLANQQKRLAANWTNIADVLSNIFIPTLAKSTGLLNEILQLVQGEIDFQNKQLDELIASQQSQKVLELTDAQKKYREELSKQREVITAAIAQAELLEEVRRRQFDLTKKSVPELRAMLDANQGNANEIREELKKREEIEEIIKRTKNALELLRAESSLERELESIRQKFEKIREGAHGNITALKLLAQQELLETTKIVEQINKIKTAESRFDQSIPQSGLQAQFAKAIKTQLETRVKLITEPSESETARKLKILQDAERELQEIESKRRQLQTDALSSMFDLLDQLNIGASKFVSSLRGLAASISSGNIFGIVTSGLGLITQLFSKSEFDRRKEQIALDKLEDEKNRLLEIARIRTDRYNEALRRINETIQTGTVAELEKQLAELNAKIAELEKITDPRRIPKELEDLKKLRDELLEKLKNFGKVGEDFASQLEFFNLQLSLLNITDPIKKLSLFTDFLKNKFGAKLPESISDFIKQGLDALERAGLDPNFLKDFLKNAGLEELTAEQFKNLLQVLNDFINGTKSAVGDITDPTTRVSLIRSITFEQGNRLLDENTTMRILQTNMVEIQMQMLSIMKDSLRGGLSSAALGIGSGAANIFIMRDGNVRRASASELTELERLQADRFLAEAKGMGLA